MQCGKLTMPQRMVQVAHRREKPMSNCAKILTTTIAIVACLLFTPLNAEAQQAEKVWRIGYLTPAPYIWLQKTAPLFIPGDKCLSSDPRF